VHGATGDTIVDNLHSLAYRSNNFGGKATIGNGSAFYFLHGDLHIFHKGQVNEGLSDGGHEWVAGDGEGPLVDLEDKVLGAKLSGVVVRGLHFVSGRGKLKMGLVWGFFFPVQYSDSAAFWVSRHFQIIPQIPI